MLENYLVTFGLISFVGLVIMVLGLRTTQKVKTGLETLGAVVFHVGVFGILYHKVDITLFISLVALVLSLFILIDPLKLSGYIPLRAYRTVGLFLLFTAIAFATMFFTNFPVWLWSIPLIIYLLPYAIPPLRARTRSLQFFAWIVVLGYMSLVTYSVYNRFYPDGRLAFLTSWFSPTQVVIESPIEENDINAKVAMPERIQEKEEVIVPQPHSPTPPFPPHVFTPPLAGQRLETEPQQNPAIENGAPANHNMYGQHAPLQSLNLPEEGPFMRNLRHADEEFARLKAQHQDLERRYRELELENARLKGQLEGRSNGQND